MTWRAHIDQGDFSRRDISIYLLDEWQGGYTLLNSGGESLTTVSDPDAAASSPTTPALQLPHAAAPALLAALSRHLGAVEHPEQLRRDYEAERKRVDTFIAHLTGRTP